MIHDTEDKLYWCKFGTRKENEFVEMMTVRGYDISINPEKETNPFAPDLLVEKRIADLKYESEPFHTSYRYTKSDGTPYVPSKTFTFNEKDYLRYKELYPDILLIFWADWIDDGIFKIEFRNLSNMIEKGESARHVLKKRINDNMGNNKANFLIDIDYLERMPL